MSTERLIHEVQKYELYEPKHKLYKDSVKKAAIWTLIGSEIDMTDKQHST